MKTIIRILLGQFIRALFQLWALKDKRKRIIRRDQDRDAKKHALFLLRYGTSREQLEDHTREDR